MLGIKESLDRMAKASSIRWYVYVLRKEDENVIVKALKFEVSGSRGRKRPKQTWIKQAENEKRKNGLVKEDACDRTKWRGVVKTMTIRNPANSVDGTIPGAACDGDDDGVIVKFLRQKVKILWTSLVGVLYDLPNLQQRRKPVGSTGPSG